MTLPPALAGLSLAEQVEHLLWANTEMTSLPEPTDERVRGLWNAGLTISEERVLSLLLKRTGPVTRDALVAAVTWDRPAREPSPKLIDVLVCRIRQKLRDAEVPGAIKSVHGIGYRWVSE